ncbi:MAG: ACP S-malonyltransferase [Synergistaceae bacterium]|nr:ACP S-malonyltransferase [Synergistaceae bacterium]
MTKYALCFPGQGAQKAGMGRELCGAFPASKAVFEEADDALSMHLTKLIFEGPDEELTLTANAQPAIMTVSVAAFRALRDDMGMNLTPAFVAGHSLGEYTALVASGVLSFRDAVRLVNKRGQWMQEAAPEGIGAMAAILGLDAETIKAVCAEAAPGGECQAANFNSPGQVVISGVAEAVDKASELAKARGARKAVRLNVSAPFHSRLMTPAAEKLKAEFTQCEWRDPKWPIVANVSAKPVTQADSIRASLYEQTFSPVLWENSVVYMADNGVDTFLELGPGEVLSGLIKRCRKGLTQKAAGTPETLEAIAKLLRGEE